MPKIIDRDRLTAKEHLLVEYMVSHPEVMPSACVMACGWKEGSVGKVLNRPRFKHALEKALEAKTAAVVKAVAKKAIITKSIIEERALEIAASGNGKPAVDALRLLAEMGGHIIHKSADMTDELKNKSEEDLEFFSINGYWPGNVDTGKPSAAEAESAGTGSGESNSKPN